MITSSIPPIETAADPIHGTDDMRERWRALMGPLGFGQRLLWVGFVGTDRCMVRALSQVPVGRAPHRAVVENLMLGLSVVLEEFEPGTSVALLLTRPGSDAVSADDRRWGEVLTATARHIGVPLQPLFRANDRAIQSI